MNFKHIIYSTNIANNNNHIQYKLLQQDMGCII